MAVLKNRRKIQAEVNSIIEEDTSKSKYLNEAEQEALSEQHEKDTASSSKVSTEKMEKAIEVVQDTFNLYNKGFSVNSFADKVSKSIVSLSNDDFDITVTIKDSEKYGIN